ncbi:MAG: hypothetical protein KDK89_20670 [Alphaproteobacteria bacterium]|nr:hypothetical protein [Alphaproteobacteria bacterium]
MLPKKIVHYWHSKENAGLVADSIATWKQVYPDFEMVQFDGDSAQAYLTEKAAAGAEFAEGVLDAYVGCYLPAMKSDIFRAYYTYLDGGMYIDASTVAIARIDERVPPGTELVLYRRWHGAINNGLFWAPAGSPFLRDFLTTMLERVASKSSNNVHFVTGPTIWTELARAHEGGPLAILILKHDEIAGTLVRFNQALPYKSDGTHWSAAQNRTSIFRTYFGPGKRIVLHLGVHKTASTLIQLALKSAEDQLAARDTAVYSAHSKSFPAYRPFRDSFLALGKHLIKAGQHSPAALETGQQLFTQPLFRKARQAFDQLMRDTAQETIIISDENLLGPPIGEFAMAGELRITKFYEAASVIASSLASIAREHNTSVILYRRDEPGLIESLYGNTISNLRFEGTIEEFLDSVDWRSISFDRLAGDLAAAFGGNLQMAGFDLIKQGPDAFMADFMARAGQAPLDLPKSFQVVNSRPSDSQVMEARRLAAEALVGPPRIEAMRALNRRKPTDDTYDLTRLSLGRRREIEQYFAGTPAQPAAAGAPAMPAAGKTARPVIGVVGNEQARPLATILGTLVPSITVPQIVIVHLAADRDADAALQGLRKCDLVLAQSVSDNYPTRFVRLVNLRQELGDKVLSWPNIFFKGQCPDICYARLPGGGRILGPLGEYQSSVSLNAWRRGLEVKDVVTAYRKGGDLISDYASVPAQSLQELADRERTLDTAISDYIAEQWRREELFFTFNHPRLKLLEMLAERILAKAGVSRQGTPAGIPAREPLGQIAPGRYPAMIELLGLQLPRKPMVKGQEIELGTTVKAGGKPRLYSLPEWVEMTFRCLDLQLDADAEQPLALS